MKGLPDGIAPELDVAVTMGAITPVSPYPEEIDAWFERSRRHLVSAELLLDTDPVASGMLSWEAVRVCAVAALLRRGLFVADMDDDSFFDDAVRYQLRPTKETLQAFRRMHARVRDDQPPIHRDGALAAIETAREVIEALTAG